MFQMADNEIGGAIVRRTFRSGGRQLFTGARLTAQEVLSFPKANRNALAEKRYIDLIPKADQTSVAAKGERFVINAGFGKFYVIEGKKLNDEPIDREQAYALAGTEAPPKVQRRSKKQ
ncbi:MAG TPA: hypothetical protein VMT89_07145 [Candidatus Acidoferrales bacterium]|nr:hypothetical protein [Candidatus Acidoferrales bacterium]